MAIAPPIPGVESLDLAPLMNREFDPADAGMTPEDYFVLTRCDGRTTFKQICTIAGFPEPQTMAILAKLRKVGAILLPGEPPPRRSHMQPTAQQPRAAPRAPATVPPSVAGAAPANGPAPRATPASVAAMATAAPVIRAAAPHVGIGIEPPRARRFTEPAPPGAIAGERARTPSGAPPSSAALRTVTIPPELLAEDCELSEDQKRGIYTKAVLLREGTLFDLLEVDPDADRKTLKRAYFKISKDFHPDRFYGKRLGSFHQMLGDIFKAATDAFELLDDDGKREAYRSRLRQGSRQTPAAGATTSSLGGSQSRAERAVELFDQACQHEAAGEVKTALAEFSAAIQLDPLPRYLRRAAEACLRASELSSAEEYVKKFAGLSPRDASAHRMLAKVLRAQGRNRDALGELETASRLDPENVHIAAELEELHRIEKSSGA